MGIRHATRSVLGGPLLGTGGAARQLPFVVEEVVEVAARPRRGGRGPGAFEPTRDGVLGIALAEGTRPAQALLLDAGGLGLGTDVVGGAGRAVCLAESVAAGDERDGLLVVHGHAAKGLADVASRGQRIRVPIRAFGIHVDEAHLDGGQGGGELAVPRVALVREPLTLRPPVDVGLGLPDILTSAGEAESSQAGILQRAVAREDHQVGPRDALAILLLEGPQQAARLVEVAVVWPAVQRREAQRAVRGSATTIPDAVRARAVPRHADEERTVVLPVSRPPRLGGGHELGELLLQGR